MSLPSGDLNVAFGDNNVMETRPQAVNAYTYVGQWLMACASDECSASMTFHFEGVQRRYTLVSLKDLQIKYEPRFNHNGMMGKAFMIVQNRQLLKIVGGKIFASLSQVADNLMQLIEEIVPLMQTAGVTAISTSNRTPLNQISEYAAHEVIPVGAFYFTQKPDFNMM
uniref:Uncharacterized protein n=1 Tax=Clandestinovirus TaxID=2831644 RepID=A0A8F8KLP5_9VIRU|nr:hypothetical protein KOM_12_421 [Clandestinovirus]